MVWCHGHVGLAPMMFLLELQVPLGTVVHKVVPATECEEEEEEDGQAFPFQQHWVGARDYVSSDEEDEGHAKAKQTNLEVNNAALGLSCTGQQHS